MSLVQYLLTAVKAFATGSSISDFTGATTRLGSMDGLQENIGKWTDL